MLIHKGTKAIETTRLLLRKAQPEDAQAMFRNWASDPEVTRYLTWPTHGTVEISQRILQSWCDSYAAPDYYQWLIVPKELGEPIGSISIVRQDDKQSLAEIGYCIGKPWWHKGFTSEALQAVIHYLFTEVGFARLEARHDPRNPNSGHVMKKSGMRYKETTYGTDRNNQGICDCVYYAIKNPVR